MINKMELEEKYVVKFLKDTKEHKKCVERLMLSLLTDLINNIDDFNIVKYYRRAMDHDNSKLNDTLEFNNYVLLNKEMEGVNYGTNKYKEIVKKYSIATELHYKNNSHHPEHYSLGVNQMDTLDLIEMICDWCSVLTLKKIEDWESGFIINKKRFNIYDELYTKIYNTARYILKKDAIIKSPNIIK